jgi:hypothetical protein
VHRVVWKVLLELAVELRGEGLVVRNHQCRLSVVGNHMRHGERLPRSGHAQEDLVLGPLFQPSGQLGNGLGLIAGWLVL